MTKCQILPQNTSINRTPLKKQSKARKAYKHKYTDTVIEALADEMIEWFETKIVTSKGEKYNLWFRDFAIQKRIPRQRFSEFAKKNKYFKYVNNICKDIQESRLFKTGMSSRANATMAIFALKNVSQWRDNQAIHHSGEVEYNINFKITGV